MVSTSTRLILSDGDMFSILFETIYPLNIIIWFVYYLNATDMIIYMVMFYCELWFGIAHSLIQFQLLLVR